MIFLGKTAERTKVFHYPDPYLVIPETIALKADHPLRRITSVGDLYGLRLGFLVGGRIPKPLQSERITYDLIAGKRLMERNVEKLLLGRIDGIYAPLSTALVNIVEDMRVRDEIKLVPIEFLGPVEIYSVFSRKTVSIEVVGRYNAALETAKREIHYREFLENYLKKRRK
jgi:ABC-type amino acid transport substrate-binding protein